MTRLAGLAALALAYVLGRRLGGRTVGALALTGVFMETDFVWNSVRGDSEGMLIAFAFGAFLAHLEGRHRLAFVLGSLAGGLRPEIWPLLAAYGFWLLHAKRTGGAVALVAGSGIALLAVWFLPDAITTGNWFQSGDRAIVPVEGTPATKPFPFGAALVEAAPLLVWPLYLGAAYSAWRGGPARWLAVTGFGLILLIAVLAEVGFTGNIRYAILPGALLAIAGAAGLPGLVARTPVALRAAGGVLTAAALLWSAGALVDRMEGLEKDQRVLTDGLDRAIALAGGPDAILGCRPITTTPLERQRLAYVLHIPQRFISERTIDRGTALVRDNREIIGGIDLPVVGVTDYWTVRQAC